MSLGEISAEAVKTALDVVATTVTLAALLQWLPVVVLVLTGVWNVIRITEWAIKKCKGRRAECEKGCAG